MKVPSFACRVGKILFSSVHFLECIKYFGEDDSYGLQGHVSTLQDGVDIIDTEFDTTARLLISSVRGKQERHLLLWTKMFLTSNISLAPIHIRKKSVLFNRFRSLHDFSRQGERVERTISQRARILSFCKCTVLSTFAAVKLLTNFETASTVLLILIVRCSPASTSAVNMSQNLLFTGGFLYYFTGSQAASCIHSQDQKRRFMVSEEGY